MEKLPIISERLKELRLKLEMSQSEFSKSISLKPQTYSAYEKNINLPPVVVLARIAEKYGVSLDWLCGFSNSEEKTVRLDTYADILKLIFELGSLDCVQIDDGKISLNDSTINNAIQGWQKMRNLLNAGTIDQEVYDLWVEKTLNNLTFPITQMQKQ